MASDTATPPALRWVALFLLLCAVLGLWMGFKDQIRRNPPDWYTGATSQDPGAPAGASGIRDATPFDPTTKAAPVEQAAAPQPKAADAKPDEPADVVAGGADAATATTAATTTPAAAAPRPKTTTPAAPKPSSDDPVGDILDGQKPAPDGPPTVPY
jgi:hypothetical protein